MKEIDAEKFDRLLNHSGVRVTICKNRFEVVVIDQSAMNDQKIVNDMRSWLNLHRKDMALKDGKE